MAYQGKQCFNWVVFMKVHNLEKYVAIYFAFSPLKIYILVFFILVSNWNLINNITICVWEGENLHRTLFGCDLLQVPFMLIFYFCCYLFPSGQKDTINGINRFFWRRGVRFHDISFQFVLISYAMFDFRIPMELEFEIPAMWCLVAKQTEFDFIGIL